MDTIIFSDKGTTETLPLTVNFADRLQYGEVITSAGVSVVVTSGIDPSPSSMLSGATTYTGTTISQTITGGVAGVTYTLVYLCTGSGSHNYVKQGSLSVLAPATF